MARLAIVDGNMKIVRSIQRYMIMKSKLIINAALLGAALSAASITTAEVIFDPYLVCDMLSDSGLEPLQGYKGYPDTGYIPGEGDYYCSSLSKEVVPPKVQTLTTLYGGKVDFSVTGTKNNANKIWLNLDIYDPDVAYKSKKELLKLIGILHYEMRLPAVNNDIKSAILQGVTKSWNAKDHLINLKYSAWHKSKKGYSLHYYIKPKKQS